MNEKHQQVCQWLDAVFGGESVPVFEVNSFTVDYLWNIMKKNQKQDDIINLIIEDLRQKASEYSLEARRIENILSSVGLSPSTLSKSGTSSLSTLVNMASVLHTKDVSDTSLMLAMSELELTSSRLFQLRKVEQKALTQLLSKTKTAFQTYAMLKKILRDLDEEAKQCKPEIEKKAKQMAFLHAKGKEYRVHINQLQNSLKSTGMEPSLYHSTLVRRSEELQASRERLHGLRAKLDSYQKLPPDLALAKVKIEEVRKEIATLEEEISSHIDVMHM